MDLTHYSPRGATGLLRPVDRFIAVLDLAAAWALVVLVSTMVAVVSAQVALRYLLNNSIDWADEVSRLCFVWSMFIAIPLGLKSGAHIGVDTLVSHFPPPVQRQLARSMALLGAALLLLVAWESAAMAFDQWDELMASANASAAWFIVPVAICGAHGALHLLWVALVGPDTAAPALLEELG
jgi:TRAP-type C4-dicarboxylate transport system permease small subunit